jgi:hypothetical protein
MEGTLAFIIVSFYQFMYPLKLKLVMKILLGPTYSEFLLMLFLMYHSS